MRKKVLNVCIHVIVFIVFFGFWMPFAISHDSNELPLIGGLSLVAYIIYYAPKVWELVKRL